MHMLPGLIANIHQKPQDALGYHVLSDYLEEEGHGRTADAIRLLVHHGAHEGAHMVTPRRWDTNVYHEGANGLALVHDGATLLLPHNSDTEHQLLREYREMRPDQIAGVNDSHPEFQARHDKLWQVGKLMSTFSHPSDQRHLYGLKILALLRRPSGLAIPLPPTRFRPVMEKFEMPTAGKSIHTIRLPHSEGHPHEGISFLTQSEIPGLRLSRDTPLGLRI